MHTDSDEVVCCTTDWQGAYDQNRREPSNLYSTDWECPYCMRLNPSNLYQCAGCTASRRKEYV